MNEGSPTTAGPLLAEARRRLAEAPFEASAREAALLLSRLLGVSEARLVAHEELPVPASAARRFRELLERRLDAEPVAYLLGEREFYGRTFRVDDRVLVPRPETEHLVEAALALELPARPRILDVGTGSGCLAVTLALELQGARVAGTDRSPAALAVAAANARRLGATNVSWAAADLLGALTVEPFDLVVSNPPYIAPRQLAELSPEIVRHEPRLALAADDDGLAVARRLLAALAPRTGEPSGLRPSARLVLEIGAGQRPALADAAADAGLELLEVVADLAGIERVLLLGRR